MAFEELTDNFVVRIDSFALMQRCILDALPAVGWTKARRGWELPPRSSLRAGFSALGQIRGEFCLTNYSRVDEHRAQAVSGQREAACLTLGKTLFISRGLFFARFQSRDEHLEEA